jgi:hypothetical protein
MMKRSHRHRRSRGFATTFALFLVILVAGALLAITTLSVADARRTTDEAIEAQVRQLFRTALQEQPIATGSLALPAELARQPASVQITREVGDGTAGPVVRITVKLHDRTAEQTIPLPREGASTSAGTPWGEGP